MARRIEIDSVGAENLSTELKFRQDGHLLLEEYLPQPDPDKEPQPAQPLPFGFKLSNNLPNVLLKNYNMYLHNYLNNISYCYIHNQKLIFLIQKIQNYNFYILLLFPKN